MFADPQGILYNAVAKTLPAIGRTDSQSEYRLVDEDGVVYNFTLSHQFGKRNRAVVRLRRDSLSPDPLVPDRNIPVSATCTLTVDFPLTGVTPSEAELLVMAVTSWLGAGNAKRLAGGET